MRVIAMLLLLASCGRLHFDERADGGGDGMGSSMPPGAFDTATLITTFVSGVDNDDPAISPDGLELYVVTSMGGPSEDIYVSTRTTRTAPWSALTKVVELSTDPITEKGPELAGDGLTMYYLSDNDIMVAHRTAIGAPWVPSFTGINGQYGTPAVCDDERQLYMRDGDDGFQDLVVSRRESKADPWPMPVLATELNSTSDDGGPWVSPDCGRIYFDSDRDRIGVLYSADRIPGADGYGPVAELAAFANMLTNVHDPSLTTDERIMVFGKRSGGVQEVWETRR